MIHASVAGMSNGRALELCLAELRDDEPSVDIVDEVLGTLDGQAAGPPVPARTAEDEGGGGGRGGLLWPELWIIFPYSSDICLHVYTLSNPGIF